MTPQTMEASSQWVNATETSISPELDQVKTMSRVDSLIICAHSEI